STVTRELRPELVLPVDLSGPDLVAALRRTPAGEYLVLDAGGAVHGVVSAADIRRAVGA
nr:site-2 protease family protein [Acidothermales bacterium]